jgi:predicted Zn-dependent peptidase
MSDFYKESTVQCGTNNKIKVLSDPMSSIESVSVGIMVKTGSRDEEEKDNGISHFLEHMAFKGTTNRTAKQLAEDFDRIGGRFNAYTSRESTMYYAKLPKDDLAKAIEILSDILQNSTYEQEELEKERGVILQELANTEDTPDDIIFDHFYAAAYPNQAFGRSILGKREFLNNVSRNDILQYVNSRYYYDNLLVSAAGNLEHAELVELVEKRLHKFSDNQNYTQPSANYSGGDIRVEKDLEQVHIVMGFPGVSKRHEDYYIQQVFSIILGGGMSSRLFQEVREKRGLAYTVSAFGSGYIDTGLFGIYSGTSQENVNQLIDVVAEQMHDVGTTLSEDELERAKAQVRAGLQMSQESSSYRMDTLARNYATFGRAIPIEEIIEKINHISMSDVTRFAKGLVTPQKNAKPTLAAIGKIEKLYDYNTICSKFY